MMNDFEQTIAITNRAYVKGNFYDQIRRVVSLHPAALILREKDLSDPEYEAAYEKVSEICTAGDVRCFLHGRPQLAEKMQAKCLHLPVSALPEARSTRSQNLRPMNLCDHASAASSHPSHIRLLENLCHLERLSVSCHSLEDVRKAEAAGATDLILGTIFSTQCKPGKEPAGLDFLAEICRQTRLPVYAIGGIKPENLDSVLRAGAAGGCMMSWFMEYDAPC